MTIKSSTRPVAGPREMVLEQWWSCCGRGKNGHSERGEGRGRTRCPEQDRSKSRYRVWRKGNMSFTKQERGKNSRPERDMMKKSHLSKAVAKAFYSPKQRIKSESLREWSRGKTNCPELSRSTAKCPEQDWGKLDEPGGAGAKPASSSGAGITPSCLVGAGAILTAR